jgi:hypothetical protein
MRWALAVEACLMKHVPDILRTGVRFDGLDTFRDANRQHAARMERLTQHWVIEAQITRNSVDMAPWSCLDALGGPLDLVEQGQHIPGIARMARGHQVGKEETRGRFRDDTGLSATRRWAMALALDHGSNRGIVGIDKCTVAELLALGEPRGLPADGLMGAHRRAQLPGKTLALGLTQRLCLFKTLLGLVGKGLDGRAKCQELRFGVAHQLDKDMRVAPAAATKAPQDFFALVLEAVGLLLELGRPAAALVCDVLDEFSRFF